MGGRRPATILSKKLKARSGIELTVQIGHALDDITTDAQLNLQLTEEDFWMRMQQRIQASLLLKIGE